MPLGDSITQADSEHDSYRRVLWQTLRGADFDVDFVGSHQTHHRGDAPTNDFDRDHEGHWGIRTDEVNLELFGWLQAANPDILLVHLGSNDVFQQQTSSSTISDLERLIDTARRANPAVTILMAQLIPTTQSAANRRLSELNLRIAEMVARKSSEASALEAVDQFSGFVAMSMTYDGVHPNREGEQRLAMRWFQTLTRYLENPAPNAEE